MEEFQVDDGDLPGVDEKELVLAVRRVHYLYQTLVGSFVLGLLLGVVRIVRGPGCFGEEADGE